MNNLHIIVKKVKKDKETKYDIKLIPGEFELGEILTVLDYIKEGYQHFLDSANKPEPTTEIKENQAEETVKNDSGLIKDDRKAETSIDFKDIEEI